MTYKDFFRQIRDNLKDVDTDATASIPSAELGRFILKAVRAIQTDFPEARLDSRGNLRSLETVAYTESTAGTLTAGAYPPIPLPEEFEPALEAHVMASCHGRDSNDAKDESLLRHWRGRYNELTGVSVG
jgi:hypothetical protein